MMRKNHMLKKSMRVVDSIVNFAMLLLLLSFLLYGGYSMWDDNQMYTSASSINYAPYRPTREEELGFEELRDINPNVFGWINIYGTNIDYPLLQGEDNDRYVHTNARGEPARAGAIFLDFRNDPNLTDFNNIIYGHDMARGAMFGDIARFEDEFFFESHRFGMIFTGQEYYGLEVFAFLQIDANDAGFYNPQIIDPADKEAFIARIFDEAIQIRDIDITINDRLIMMSTCTPTATNGRHILMARLMDEVPEDVLDGVIRGQGIDNLFGLGFLRLAVGSLLVIFLTIGVTLLISKIKKKKQKDEKLRKPPTLLEEMMFLVGEIIIILLSLVLLFTFVFGFTQVDDASMAPAMREGDIVIFQRTTQQFIATDAVIVQYEGETQVRRIVAVAGDTVDINEHGLMINGLFQQEFHIFEETTQFVDGVTFPLVVPEGEVFVLGDGRVRAYDSRMYGTIRIDDILGSVVTVFRRRNM